MAIVRRHGVTLCVVKSEVLQAYGDSSQAWGHAVRTEERGSVVSSTEVQFPDAQRLAEEYKYKLDEDEVLRSTRRN